jgi:hypothetical protein
MAAITQRFSTTLTDITQAVHRGELTSEQGREAHDRALLKAQRIRINLSATGNMTEPFPEKPKGMHWRTYYRLREQEQRANPFILASVVTEANSCRSVTLGFS